jgi:hypothetical protein
MALKKRLLPRNKEGIDDYVGMQFKAGRLSDEIFTVERFDPEKNSYDITYIDGLNSVVKIQYSAINLREKLKIKELTLIS